MQILKYVIIKNAKTKCPQQSWYKKTSINKKTFRLGLDLFNN